MKAYFFGLLMAITVNSLMAQKSLIDTTAYDAWPSAENASLSIDGKFTLYTLRIPGKNSTVHLQSIDGKWRKDFNKFTDVHFADNRAIYLNSNDSLCLQQLGNSAAEYIPNVASFNMPGKNKNILAYSEKNATHNLVLRMLKTNTERKFAGVDEYYFSEGAKIVLLLHKEESTGKNILSWVNLNDDRITEIWKGSQVGNFQFDRKESQLVFEVTEKEKRSWWYYRQGVDRPILLLDSHSIEGDLNLEMGNLIRFSNEGKRLFVNFKEKPLPRPDSNAVRLNVWSYQDARLQPSQIIAAEEAGVRSYLFVFDLATRKLTRLQQKNETIVSGIYPDSWSPDIHLTVEVDLGGIIFEKHWNKKSEPERWLVSTIDGSRQRLPFGLYELGMSNSGKYILYSDKKAGHIGAYEITSGKYRLITEAIPTSIISNLNNRGDVGALFWGKGTVGWLKNDEAVLVNDQFDLWQVDPLCKKKPVNLTRGYGRKINMELRPITFGSSNPVFNSGEKLLLTGFNPDTKENGFLSMIIGSSKEPELLSKGFFTWYAPQKLSFLSQGREPVKALQANRYLIQRESTEEYPNYFTTSDFRTFTPLTDLQPQKNYNWMTADLHSWKSLDGQILHGALYKPENFDPKKKYPVIFYYYEILSDDITSFHHPVPSNGTLNIPWYVSNGYLVFTPDIHLTIGEPMQGTYNSIVSAAKYLSEIPYVNEKKMGIQGISFGGIQTNYLVTHTNFFAAACSASGTSNFISHYGALSHGDNSCQISLEQGQIRIGSTLWERPEWYIANSPVMSAPNVTTPFLMMHTSIDGACPFPQAVELFTDLRRLGKKVWLLEYQDGNHGLSGKPANDFTIRMAQFFDHYLKDKPAPVWMTRGIPAARKGLDLGLEVDNEIKTPGEGLLIPGEIEKVNSLMTRKPITITLR